MNYILILTMLFVPGEGGGGGLATAEFNSKLSCETAGMRWQREVSEKYKHLKEDRNTFYVCVGKY